MLSNVYTPRFILFPVIVIFLLLLSCEKHTDLLPDKLAYESFRDIPGITASEIEAIEALRAKDAPFIYGMPLSTEGFYNKNGEIIGYTTLLCQYLTKIFGIDFKPAIYEWDDLIAGLANGSIDFTGDLTSSEERRKTYYMTDAIVERTLKYFRLKDAMPISRIKTMRLPRYGFLEGAVTHDMVSLLSDHKFEAFFVPSHNAVYDALINEQIDAFLDENGVEVIFDQYDDMVSSDFLPLIYISASLSTQNPELVSIISIVQKMQHSDHSKYLLDLYNQGYQEYLKSKLELKFSEEEHEYIKQNPVVRFAAEFDNYPVSFYNRYENRWQGAIFDMLEKVEQLTGLTFEVTNAPDANWTELLEDLENGKVSMISELLRSEDREGRFIWSEIELMQDRHALVSKLEHPDFEINEILYTKVGLTKNTAHTQIFKNWFPNHSNTMEFENAERAFAALELGEIDLFMTSQNRVLTMTNYMEQPGYKVNVLFDNNFGSFLGFNKNEHTLRSIVDKSLRHVDIKRISDRWKHKSYDYRVKLAESRRPLLVGICILLFCVIILLLVLYRTNRTEGKRLEALVHKRTAELEEQHELLEYMSLTDPLTDLPNRRNFDMRLEIEWRIAIREKQKISFLMLDIDHFKIYNDKYGHQNGDKVLCAIARTIEETLKRPGDFVARWGGEEFAVLLSNTDVEGASKIAEALRANVEKINVSMDSNSIDKLTISIGVNTQAPEQNSPLETFISIADKELYRAKEMGRNKICVH
jgi:diguanylate cyclase (GGDEF)-like protein